jgi:hypothetical protein
MVSRAQLLKVRETKRRQINPIRLLPRAEVVLGVPVKRGSPRVGIINKRHLQDGVFLAASLTAAVDGYAMTSVLNTNEEEKEVQEPVVELEEIGQEGDVGNVNVEFQERERDILAQLRVDHLNAEERKILMGTCSDFSDIFYLPGDRLSSTGVVQHSIIVEAGTHPINTRPYRLPEAKKGEVRKRVHKLLQEGIIEESNSPWNSPILIIPKRWMRAGNKNSGW